MGGKQGQRRLSDEARRKGCGLMCCKEQAARKTMAAMIADLESWMDCHMPHCHSLITILTVTRHSLRRKKKQHDCCAVQGGVALPFVAAAPPAISQPRQGALAAP
jgi:hypothetical protein